MSEYVSVIAGTKEEFAIDFVAQRPHGRGISERSAITCWETIYVMVQGRGGFRRIPYRTTGPSSTSPLTIPTADRHDSLGRH